MIILFYNTSCKDIIFICLIQLFIQKSISSKLTAYYSQLSEISSNAEYFLFIVSSGLIVKSVWLAK